MMKQIAAVIAFGTALLAWQPATAAGNNCVVTLDPKLSGFKFNPVIDRLTVTSAKPTAPGKLCVVHAGDEILRVNEKKIVGSRALAFQRYWKSLRPGAPVTFQVKRAGSVMLLTSK